jgi:DNA-binding transcriptional regulator GbsR (MarR family)
LMRDPFTMDKEDIIKQLIEESPNCLQSLLCYLDDKDIHSTLYLTFFEVFEKVWGRIIRSDFKADLIKRLDEEMMESECKCFTGRMSRLVNVLVGFFSDINITVSNNERIGAIISSVLKGRDLTDELKEVCRKSLKEAEIEDDEIAKWLDV